MTKKKQIEKKFHLDFSRVEKAEVLKQLMQNKQRKAQSVFERKRLEGSHFPGLKAFWEKLSQLPLLEPVSIKSSDVQKHHAIISTLKYIVVRGRYIKRHADASLSPGSVNKAFWRKISTLPAVKLVTEESSQADKYSAILAAFEHLTGQGGKVEPKPNAVASLPVKKINMSEEYLAQSRIRQRDLKHEVGATVSTGKKYIGTLVGKDTIIAVATFVYYLYVMADVLPAVAASRAKDMLAYQACAYGLISWVNAQKAIIMASPGFRASFQVAFWRAFKNMFDRRMDNEQVNTKINQFPLKRSMNVVNGAFVETLRMHIQSTWKVLIQTKLGLPVDTGDKSANTDALYHAIRLAAGANIPFDTTMRQSINCPFAVHEVMRGAAEDASAKQQPVFTNPAPQAAQTMQSSLSLAAMQKAGWPWLPRTTKKALHKLVVAELSEAHKVMLTQLIHQLLLTYEEKTLLNESDALLRERVRTYDSILENLNKAIRRVGSVQRAGYGWKEIARRHADSKSYFIGGKEEYKVRVREPVVTFTLDYIFTPSRVVKRGSQLLRLLDNHKDPLQITFMPSLDDVLYGMMLALLRRKNIQHGGQATSLAALLGQAKDGWLSYGVFMKIVEHVQRYFEQQHNECFATMCADTLTHRNLIEDEELERVHLRQDASQRLCMLLHAYLMRRACGLAHHTGMASNVAVRWPTGHTFVVGMARQPLPSIEDWFRYLPQLNVTIQQQLLTSLSPPDVARALQLEAMFTAPIQQGYISKTNMAVVRRTINCCSNSRIRLAATVKQFLSGQLKLKQRTKLSCVGRFVLFICYAINRFHLPGKLEDRGKKGIQKKKARCAAAIDFATKIGGVELMQQLMQLFPKLSVVAKACASVKPCKLDLLFERHTLLASIHRLRTVEGSCLAPNASTTQVDLAS